MTPHSCIRSAVIAVMFANSLGCSDNRAEVTGRVTLVGKPLSEGVVSFRPKPGTAGPEFSGRVATGIFSVEKPVLPGVYKVEIRSWAKTGRIVKGQFGEDIEEIASTIPTRYRGDSSELNAQLQPGPNRLDFDLRP